MDLTMKDPYYLLPIMTASTLAINLKLGIDSADPSTMPPMMVTFMKFLPFITLLATMNFPTVRLNYNYI